MSRMSDNVKAWRKRTKERIVEAFGGRCGICKKKYPPEVFDLHHLADDKEFSLGAIRASIKSWAKIIVELRKCTLLCANCHRLLHYGYEALPASLPVFNEEYSDYTLTKDKKSKEINVCEVCGDACANRFCSRGCVYRSQLKVVDRPTKEEIQKLVDLHGYKGTGRKFGVCGNTISNWLHK